MKKLVTISDYYLQDVPEGTLFKPHDVSSVPDELLKRGQLINRTKWRFHNKPYEWENSIIANVQNYVSFLGKGLKATVLEKPDEKILQHWGKVFGDELVPEFAGWGIQEYTISKYPDESLPAELHSVHGDILYKLNSKKFIGEINVPQAKIFSEFKAPCCVKATHSSDGNQVYFVHTEEEYLQVIDKLNLPRNEFIITELVQDVAMTYNTHIYVTKKGEVQWISAAEQHLPGKKTYLNEWLLKIDDQPSLKELLYPSCKIVGEALHKEGYFGYCGIDIVVDEGKNTYVVDINPRVNGSTGIQLATLFLHEKKGYTVGSHRKYIPMGNMPLADIIRKLESIENGTATLVTALPDANAIQCSIRVFAFSLEVVDQIFQDIYQWS